MSREKRSPLFYHIILAEEAVRQAQGELLLKKQVRQAKPGTMGEMDIYWKNLRVYYNQNMCDVVVQCDYPPRVDESSTLLLGGRPSLGTELETVPAGSASKKVEMINLEA